jgi:hypothetical protein
MSREISEAEVDRVLAGARATWKAGIAADEATRQASERGLAEMMPQRRALMSLGALAFAAVAAMILLARRHETAHPILPEPPAAYEERAAAAPPPVVEPAAEPAVEPSAEPPRVVRAPSKSALPPLPPPPPARDDRAHYRRAFADRSPEEVFRSATDLARAASSAAERAAIWDAALERMPQGPLRAHAATERARAAARTLRHRKTDL